MKTTKKLCFVVLLSSLTVLCQAQQTATVPPTTPFSIVSRGPDCRVWESISYELSPSGQIIPHTHRYVELATGLCYPGPDGQWLDSQEEINILPDGTASATNGQHQVYFPVDIYNGTITLITPDGLQMQSRPLGLCYDDGTNLVLIGALTNSVGSLVTNNQVIYPNAFMGIDADLRYSYRLSGFEQEIVLRQQLPPPEAFGLDSAYANLEMLTEFFSPPEPTPSASVAGPNGLSDATLSFGSMKMVRGKAFSIGDSSSTNSEPGGIRVYKSWEHVGDRTFLVEALPYQQITSDLSRLPAAGSVIMAQGTSVVKAFMARILPQVRSVQAGAHQKRIATASWHYQSGVVLDYVTINSGSDETNFTFQGDTTYLVTGGVNLFGTTTIEGGTVVKYNDGTDGGIYFYGPVNCETAPYRKAVFTASDDNSVGEGISGSSGHPSGYYSEWAFNYQNDNPPYSVTLHDLEINYSWYGLDLWCGSNNVIRDVQLLDNYDGLTCWGVTNYLENALIYSTTSNGTCIFEDGSSTIAENLTADGGNGLWVDYSSSLAVTNCLFSGLATLDNHFAVGSYYSNSLSSAIFQTVGGGSHYLATNSTVNDNIRCQGTANIDPALLADLAQKTTWPPMVFSNITFSVITNFSPQVPRDTNSSPDLGYHYDVLDYVFGGCNLSSNVTFAAGTAVGWFESYGGADSYGQPYGIALNNGANLAFDGNASQPDYFVKFDMVQEGENGNWPPSGFIGGIMFNGNNLSQEPLLAGNFTKFSNRMFGHGLFRDYDADGGAGFENCEFYTLGFSMYDMQDGEFTNCLFFRCGVTYYGYNGGQNINYDNCTFFNGGLGMNRSSACFWQVENCAFDGTDFTWSNPYGGNSNSYTLFNYNAYNTNNSNWENYQFASAMSGMLETNGPNDVTVSNYNWETGLLGNFYLPTNSPLITNGSTMATVLGLSDFTTQTNQVPDGTNIVDIGYHYFAVNPPVISIEPSTPSTVIQGDNTNISVTVTGSGPLGYQWYWDGYALSDEGGVLGSGSATLTLNGVNPSEAGNYFVVITNDFGSITSSVVTLIVQPSQNDFVFPPYIFPPYACWNVTDISDPAQPVNIGELPAPFSEPSYSGAGLVPENTLWHYTNIPIINGFGTASYGGTNHAGTVFTIGLGGQGLTVIHTFNGTNDGASPCSQLAISGSTFYSITNVLYGTTRNGGIGGTNGYGTIFKLNSDGTDFTNLYEFTGGNDGKYPQSGLLIDGNLLYGTTTNSVFKINTDGTDFTCLTNVTNASQLILALPGDTLFGTTYSGGTSNEGMLFSISTHGTNLIDLHDFTGGTNGAFPNSGLELLGCSNLFNNGSTTDILYGTTYSGGASNYGMVFSINTDGSDFTDLYDFTNGTDGANPIGELLLTNNNYPWTGGTYLFGTTSSGGLSNGGTIFGMNLDGSGFTTLFSFGGTNGIKPEGKLTFEGGILYGTTSAGGVGTNGTVFSITNDGSSFNILYDFSAVTNGSTPLAGVAVPVADSLNSIWSLDTTLNVSAGDVTNLSYSLAIDDSYAMFVNDNLVGINLNGFANWLPNSPLPYLQPGENNVKVIIAGNDDGNDYFSMFIQAQFTNTINVFTNMFGTTSSGGTFSGGTVFDITNGGNEIILRDFTNPPDGNTPIGDLVLSGTNLYGVTEYGGTNDGTIFSLSTDGSNYKTLYRFSTVTNDGRNPEAGLLLVGTNLYGTTCYGGPYNGGPGDGIIFSICTNGSNYQVLHDFTGSDGAYSQAPLILAGTNLYGTTSSGGNIGIGTIFSICTNGSNYQTLYSFGSLSVDGNGPQSGLTLSGNTLYGTTRNGGYGGGSGNGTIFGFTIGGTNVILHYFSNTTNDGQFPEAGLTLSGNVLYGTTANGGTYGDGTIFSIGVDGNGYKTILGSFGSLDHLGKNPEADVEILSNSLYGTTLNGGTNTYGMVFSVNTNGTDFNDLYDFKGGLDGEYPEGGLSSP